MKGRLIGRRTGLFERSRLLVFDDRLELLADGGFSGWDVRRLFFDEVSCATVAPQIQWAVVVLSSALGLALLLPGLALLSEAPSVSVPMCVAALALLAAGAVSLLAPRQRLVVHAPGQSFDALLPRPAAARARALDELRRAIESYQARADAA